MQYLKEPSMMYITPLTIRGKKKSGWLVKFLHTDEDNKCIHKTFSFSVYGSKAKTLKAAKKFRDKTAKELGGRFAERCKGKNKYFETIPTNRNTSGTVGVNIYNNYYTRKISGEIINHRYWLATFPIQGKRDGTKAFSVNKYGYEEAKEMAIAYRKQMEKEILKNKGK